MWDFGFFWDASSLSDSLTIFPLATLSVVLPCLLLQATLLVQHSLPNITLFYPPGWSAIPDSKNTCNRAIWGRTSLFCNHVNSLLNWPDIFWGLFLSLILVAVAQ